MITDRAKELAKQAYKSGLENIAVSTKAAEDLMEELRKNCEPTLEEFTALVGNNMYKPENVWQINWGTEAVRQLWKRQQ